MSLYMFCANLYFSGFIFLLFFWKSLVNLLHAVLGLLDGVVLPFLFWLVFPVEDEGNYASFGEALAGGVLGVFNCSCYRFFSFFFV